MALQGSAHGVQPVFDGESYDYWSIKMKTLLISQDLWKIVEEGVVVETNTEKGKEKVETSDETKEKKKRDAKALYLIQQSISEKIFPRIIGANCAKEAWECLQQEFQGTDKVRSVKLLTLKRNFQNLQMKEKESMTEYFSKVIELVNQIKSLGENLGDKAVCEKILISLSLKYNNIAAIIEETKDLSTLSVHDLMGSLEIHEQRMSRNGEQSFESAFQSKVNVKESGNQNASNGNASRGGYGGGRGRGNFGRGGCRGNNHGGGGNNQGGEVKICHHCKMPGHIEKFYRNKGRPQCYHCKRFGHIEKFCKIKNDGQANYIEEKKNNEGEKKNDESIFYACQAAVEKKDDV